MAKLILDDVSITIDSVALSYHGNRVEISSEKDLQETTAFGSNSKEYLLGLGDGTMSFTFQQDYSATSVDDTLWDIHDAGDPVVIVVKPTSGAVSATNPSYTMTGVLPAYTPVSGDVGQVSTIECQFQNADPSGIVRGTT
jgi:hypothetical protein